MPPPRIPRQPGSPVPLNICQRHRQFSTTRPVLSRPRTNPLSLLRRNTPPPPPYPYGPSRFYKQRDTGLYGSTVIQFGHNVSPETEIKTPRRWYPNVQHKRVFSDALGRHLRLKVTTRVLRSIDKLGGLDNYLLGNAPARLKELGPEGWRLRWAVLWSPAIQRRLRASEPDALAPSLRAQADAMREEMLLRKAAAVANAPVVDKRQGAEGDSVTVAVRKERPTLETGRGQLGPKKTGLWARMRGAFGRA